MLSQVLSHLRMHAGIAQLPRVESIRIAVVYAEGSSNRNGVMDLAPGVRARPVFYQAGLSAFPRYWRVENQP